MMAPHLIENARHEQFALLRANHSITNAPGSHAVQRRIEFIAGDTKPDIERRVSESVRSRLSQ
jgi:hypothetical protein